MSEKKAKPEGRSRGRSGKWQPGKGRLRAWGARSLAALWAFLWSGSNGRPGLRWSVLAGVALVMTPALLALPWGPLHLGQGLGLAVLLSLVLGAVYEAWFVEPPARMIRPAPKDMGLMAGLMVLSALMASAHMLFAEAMARSWLGVSAQVLVFATPLCALPLLAALFLGRQAALILSGCAAFVVSLVWADSAGVLAYFIVTGFFTVVLARGGRTRSALIRAALRASLAGLAVVLALALYRGWLFTPGFLAAGFAVIIGQLVGGVLAAGLMPLVEMALGYTTGIHIMELGSLDHPILRELMINAPGTYHHSLVVSSLSEAAAREIGADHLVAKVAALYHDIGKVKKPDYFIENQKGGPNRHEKLAPSMSALILISHVKEGIELARKHRLGKAIMDIMAQHHGTRTIDYFYNKAVEERRAAGEPLPSRENYCYPGPRPQTREAGLVMLADTVEAASRSLANPTMSRVQKLVQTQINKIFAEGQLDDCELTLKDLHGIAKSFHTILGGIYHQRIEYPSDQEGASKQNGSDDQQPPEHAKAGPGADSNQAAGNLRRLGMLR